MITNLNKFINEKNYLLKDNNWSGYDNIGVPLNINLTGLYHVSGSGFDTDISLLGFELGDGSIYPNNGTVIFYQDNYTNRNEDIDKIEVKKISLKKMANGKTIIAKTSNGDIVKINKIKNLNESMIDGCNPNNIRNCCSTIYNKILNSTDEDIKVKLLSLCGISSDQYAQTEEYPTDIELNSALIKFKYDINNKLNIDHTICDKLSELLIKEDVDNNVILPSSNDNLDNENNNNLNDLLYVGRFIL